jgi:hypothetical protein
MSENRCVIESRKLGIICIIVFNMFMISIGFAQSSGVNPNAQPPAKPQNHPPQTLEKNPSDQDKPSRKIHRIGTAISAPRNSISIKSTEAGSIRRQSPTSGCINCGVIDFVNKMGQAPGLNAIAGGIVAGTVAREVIRQTPHLPGIPHPNAQGGMTGDSGNPTHLHNPYHIGVTMSDGKQAIIALPDASHLQQGDRIKFIDGVLVLDRE